jgi:hypothetical protein
MLCRSLLVVLQYTRGANGKEVEALQNYKIYLLGEEEGVSKTERMNVAALGIQSSSL